MTAPAFDIKPEFPRRTEIDPLKTIDALRVGYKICWKAGYSDKELRAYPQQIVWAVIVEAARTEKALEAPTGRGYGNGWPDVVHTAADNFAARASRLESGLPEYEVRQEIENPTAAQISRHEEVIIWLRFCHGEDKLTARDILWWRASGRPYPKIVEDTGLKVQRIKNIRTEQLAHIWNRLKSGLKGHDWEAAVFT